MKTRYPNVTVGPDRHGKLRARYRKTGSKPVYLRTLPDQPGFEAELLSVKVASAVVQDRHVPRSVNDLVARYYGCADFKTKGNDGTKARRRGLIESFRRDYGNDLVTDFGFEHIEEILLSRLEKRKVGKRWVGGEVAAHSLRKELVRLFVYAKKLKWIVESPVADAERIGKAKLVGYYPWTEADIATYKARHPLGTKARLALEIILWTGQRRGDARLFGPKHVTDGNSRFTPSKTKREMGMMVAPDLRAAIDAMPSVGITTFLVTDYGKPFSKDGFGNKMREWCDAAGLPQCSAHGLRKAIARRAAETEATQQQMKAIGGWRGDAEVTLYAESAEQERLANTALARVIDRFSDRSER